MFPDTYFNGTYWNHTYWPASGFTTTHGTPILVGPPYMRGETHPYNKTPRLTDFTEEERVMLLSLGVATEMARRRKWRVRR